MRKIFKMHKENPDNRWKIVLLSTLLIVFMAQVNMDLMISNFKISIGIVAFPILIVIVENFPVLPVTLCSGICVCLSRFAYDCGVRGEWHFDLSPYFPEFLFYLVYGVLLYLYSRYLAGRHLKMDGKTCFVPLVCMDYLANLAELLYRQQWEALSGKIQLSILLVALVRTFLIWLLLTAFSSYGLLLVNKEHAERYRMLLLLISKLQGEIVWMKRNTEMIENTMHTCYSLYHYLNEKEESSDAARKALEVAKDIHEVKKDYSLIVRGISEALNQNLKDGAMEVRELLNILRDMRLRKAKTEGRSVNIELQCSGEIYTEKQYYLISIFNNLLSNAEEAAEDAIHIQIKQLECDSYHLFTVTDDGKGISPENLEQIFVPGFSTKINYSTGEVNRGLGLALLKDIVEDIFEGRIEVESKPGHTCFSIYLQKSKLEEINHADHVGR